MILPSSIISSQNCWGNTESACCWECILTHIARNKREQLLHLTKKIIVDAAAHISRRNLGLSGDHAKKRSLETQNDSLDRRLVRRIQSGNKVTWCSFEKSDSLSIDTVCWSPGAEASENCKKYPASQKWWFSGWGCWLRARRYSYMCETCDYF